MSNRRCLDKFEAALANAGISCSAAEAHGTWVGMLSASPQTGYEQALKALIGIPGQFRNTAMSSLIETFTDTRQSLLDDNLGFTLLLPDDDTFLKERAVALAHWCQGFLSGLGLSGRRLWSKQVEEIMNDIQAISQLDPSAEGEEDEKAFAELVEYVRVGVQLCLTETLLAVEREKGNEQ